MVISQHLILAELIRSESAKRNGITNMPTPDHIENLKALAENIFEPIRTEFRVPIYISSAYRSAALNKFVKGSATSQHCKGEAIDVDMDGTPNGVTNADVYNFIKDNLEYDQLIWEFGTDKNPDWVHVSYCAGKNRKQRLKAVRANGKTQYLAI